MAREKQKPLDEQEIEEEGTHPYHEEYAKEKLKKKKKKQDEDTEIEKGGTHPSHEEYTKEKMVKR